MACSVSANNDHATETVAGIHDEHAREQAEELALQIIEEAGGAVNGDIVTLDTAGLQSSGEGHSNLAQDKHQQAALEIRGQARGSAARNRDLMVKRNLHHNHQNHTTAAGMAALAANASFAGNLTLPANAAFARRQRLRWLQPPPPSPSPLANPPTKDSTNPSPHRLCRNRDDYDKSGGRRYRGSIDAERVLLGERNCYGRGVARRRYRRGRRQA